MASYFVSGANRGIGLAVVQKLLKEPGNVVIAGVRDPSAAKSLIDLKAEYDGRVEIVPFDLSDPAKIAKAVELTSGFLPHGLDYLVNNAAASFQPVGSFEEVDLTLFEKEFHFNVTSQIVVVRAFLPLVRKGSVKKVVFVSSNMGSIENVAFMQDLSGPYSVTKTALNMVARKWGVTLKKEGITTITLHPGWVATDMGHSIEEWVGKNLGPLKPITTTESAEGVVKVIQAAKLEDATSFYNYDGTRVPW